MPRRGPRYSEQEAQAAIGTSRCYTEALRKLGMRAAGGNYRTLRRYAEEIWLIPTEHFDPGAARAAALRRAPIPLEAILVQNSTYNRARLKERLYHEDVKLRECEMCGQGEEWNGRRMSLILDHVNGVSDDNRLTNLRIVCPNCAATLDTHCGRNGARPPIERPCERCATPFRPRHARHRYCSSYCGCRSMAGDHRPRPWTRRVDRPPYPQLLREVHGMGFSATGRRYGVSDNAIRKWLRQYESERANGEP